MLRCKALVRICRALWGGALNLACVLLLFALTGCSIAEQNESVENSLPNPCRAALAPHRGTTALDMEIVRLQEEIQETPSARGRLEQLGWFFVAKARSADNAGYYWRAQESGRCLEALDPGNLGAVLIQGHVLHQIHQFQEAELLAQRLVEERGSPFDYGLLGDVLMEQGRLDEAADAYQTMVDMRPGLQSYSRAAHMRWLRGDGDGAVELMRMAAAATSPRDAEAAAWVHARLAVYELQAGSVENALTASETGLRFQDDHLGALLARGRILLANGRAEEAILPLIKAADRSPMPEVQWVLAEALDAAGRGNEARRIESDLVATGASRDARTLALYLATRGERTDHALELAEGELRSRQDVFSLDAHAWALAAAGHTDRARSVMAEALIAGTEDGRLYYHAGAIAAMAGQSEEACLRFGQAGAIEQMLLPSERRQLDALSVMCQKTSVY